MRLIGSPDEVAVVVDELRDEFGTDQVIKRISRTQPAHGGSGRVRVYIVLDGSQLVEELQSQ